MEKLVIFLSLSLATLTLVRQLRKFSPEFSVSMLLQCLFILCYCSFTFKSNRQDESIIFALLPNVLYLFFPALILLYHNTTNAISKKSAVYFNLSVMLIVQCIMLTNWFFPALISIDDWRKITTMFLMVGVIVGIFHTLPDNNPSGFVVNPPKLLKLRMTGTWSLVVFGPFLVQVLINIFPSDGFLFPYQPLISTEMVIEIIFTVMLSLLSWEEILLLKNSTSQDHEGVHAFRKRFIEKFNPKAERSSFHEKKSANAG